MKHILIFTITDPNGSIVQLTPFHLAQMGQMEHFKILKSWFCKEELGKL